MLNGFGRWVGLLKSEMLVFLTILDVWGKSLYGKLARIDMDLMVDGFDDPVRAVFIRAPWIAEAGEGVEVLSEVDGHPVVVRQGNVMATSFHPELTGDDRFSTMLLDLARER